MDKLTPQDVDTGIQTILENVDSLTEEAALLFQNEKFARAYTLAHLSREELAKITMLHSVGVKLLLGIDIENRRVRSCLLPSCATPQFREEVPVSNNWSGDAQHEWCQRL
jgi:hypothetical protein